MMAVILNCNDGVWTAIFQEDNRSFRTVGRGVTPASAVDSLFSLATARMSDETRSSFIGIG